jgi:nicotinate-nucleotide pyrophosphorylase (carboxylating)
MPEMTGMTPAVAALIDLALEEDLGRGDVTSAAVLDPRAEAQADLVAREPLILAGLPVALAVMARVDSSVLATTYATDGELLAAGARVASFRGRATSLLAAERTALNFVQRLSGIATATRRYVEAVRGTGLRVTDTRKTTPGFRRLEKDAVRAGGGANHRFDLGSGVLIKDNHVAVAGSVGEAVRRARAVAPHGMKIEVEVDTLAQLDEALAVGADIVLLDNFSAADVDEAVRRVHARTPRPLIEVSGGITLERLPALARAGVDLVSVGALTHSARAMDLALDVRVGAT